MSLTTYRFDCNGIHTYIHCPKHKAGRIHISYYFTFSYFRTRWMLESDWLTNVIVIIFRETLGERSSRHRITCPYYFAKWFELFQRSLQPKTAKEPKPTTTLAKQINIVNKRIKNDRSYPCFCHKITFYYVRKAHSLSPALSHRQFAHTLTYTLGYSDDFISNSLTLTALVKLCFASWPHHHLRCALFF